MTNHELSAQYYEIRKLFKHLPPEPKLQLEHNLRAVLTQIQNAIVNYANQDVQRCP